MEQHLRWQWGSHEEKCPWQVNEGILKSYQGAFHLPLLDGECKDWKENVYVTGRKS